VHHTKSKKEKKEEEEEKKIFGTCWYDSRMIKYEQNYIYENICTKYSLQAKNTTHKLLQRDC